MANTVFMDAAKGGDGNTYTDGVGDNATQLGMDGGNHAKWFIPLMSALMGVANFCLGRATAAATSATNAATSASTAATSPNTQANTTTSITPAAGAIAFTLTATGKALSVGQYAMVASAAAPTTKYIYGPISAYNSGTGAITVNVGAGYFAGTAFTDGVLSIGPPPGTTSVANTRLVSTSGLATGGGDLTADRTIAVPAAASSDVRTGSDTTKALTSAALMASSAFQTLTDATTIAWNCANGYNAAVTLTASGHTVGAPTGLYDGLCVALDIIQDATGSRTVSWNTIWDFGAAGLPALQATAAKADRVFGQYNARTGKIEASFRKGA